MTMKLMIEVSCREGHLLEAVCQLKLVLGSIAAESQDLKVLVTGENHRWIRVNINSQPNDIVEIYHLKKQVDAKILKP